MTLTELMDKLAELEAAEGPQICDYPVILDTTTIEDLLEVELRDITRTQKEKGREPIQTQIRALVLS